MQMLYPQIQISRLLVKQGKTIALAESCSGGLLANILTNIPGSSRYFLLGVVAYSNRSKNSLLGIPAALLARQGAVSAKVSRLMAQNVRKLALAEYGIGITGIAGPSGGSPRKPVGTVFISVAKKSKTMTRKFRFTGSRLAVKRKTAWEALSMLKNFL